MDVVIPMRPFHGTAGQRPPMKVLTFEKTFARVCKRNSRGVPSERLRSSSR